MRFKRTLYLGKVKETDTKFEKVFVFVNFDGYALSISSVIGPKRNGDAVSCGQSYPFELSEYAPGWDKDKVEMLVSIWDNYHLNDMRGGCEHQMEWGWTHAIIRYNPIKNGDGKIVGWSSHTDWARHGDSWQMIGKVCPVCGHRYGHTWRWSPVPLSILEILQGFPDPIDYPPLSWRNND